MLPIPIAPNPGTNSGKVATIGEELEENIFASGEIGQNGKVNGGGGSITESKDQSPEDGKLNFFSLSQVSVKINELWTTAKERVFGEDYWIPSDPYEVVDFRSELLACHKVVYPEDAEEPSLMVVQGSIKNDPSVALNHVVYSCFDAQEGGCNGSKKRTSFTIFRSRSTEEALDFCRRCEECRVLFRLLDLKKDVRKSIWDVTFMIKAHPLWRMVHIAIMCQRVDIFTEEGLSYLMRFGYSVDDLTNVVCSPEGKYPLMLAIETNQEPIVKSLLKHSADPSMCDPMGCNALHYAALASAQIVEAIMESEKGRALVNSKNNAGQTPTRVALGAVNPIILKTLYNFGGELQLSATDENPLFELMHSNKGNTTDTIRVLLEKSPKYLRERDWATGNTCLHAAKFKTPLMGLLQLRHKEVDLNAKNNAGLTPLHQFVIRDELGMVMCLASYGANLDAEATNSKITPLHMAVSGRNLEITRLLLCLGANPNPVSEHGDSPRHLAAKLKEMELLKSLIICGARRCPPTKVGCVSGCVNEKSLQVLKKTSSSPSMAGNASPPKVNSPSYLSVVEDFENRAFPKEYRYNKILDQEHNAIYDELIAALNTMAKVGGNPNVINVLTLDGGGIRGLVISQIMTEIERVLGEPLFPYFDWVAGTSTGSIITAALATGQSMRDIQRIYLRFKDMVFETRRPHNTAVLETFIQDEMGRHTKFEDIKWPRILFTTTRADYFPVQLELMRNYKLPTTEEENKELGYSTQKDLLLWKVLRRSSAAPTYFSSVDNKYIDGGIIANNPTLELLSEIQFWNSFNKFKNLPNSVRIGCVLSIGTGAIPPTKLDSAHLDLAQNYVAQPIVTYNAILTIGQILVDQVTATEGAPVSRASAWCVAQKTPFFRLSAPLFKDIQMDAKDDLEVAKMMWDCMEYMYRHQDYVEKLCALLKKVGHAWRRRDLFQLPGEKTREQQTQTSCPPSPVAEKK